MRFVSAFTARRAIYSIGAGALLASCAPDDRSRADAANAANAGDPASPASPTPRNPARPEPPRELPLPASTNLASTNLASTNLASTILATRSWGALDARVREPRRIARLPVPARPPSGDLGGIPRRFRAFAETVEAERLRQGIPGVAVGIVEGGELSFARGFGSKDPEGSEPVRASTLFRIASNTKPFTAISVLQEVERGALAIDDALVDVLPTFGLDTTPEPVPAITLRQLLSHTSGFADYLDVDVPDEQKNDAALAELLLGPFRGRGYLQSPPGALYSYSNVGYSLLGLVAEVQTRVPFRTLVRERIWKPLGMRRTFFDPSDVLADGDFALGVCLPDQPDCAGEGLGAVFAPDSYDAPSSAPAAAAWSSVLDLARWAGFLVHGNRHVLGEPLRAEMATPQVSTRYLGDIISYGLGLQHDSHVFSQPDPAGPVQLHAVTEIYHGGALPGFRSLVSCVPSLDYCLIVLTNYNEVDFFGMETAALRLIDLPEPVPPPDIAPIPERFPEYAGTYVDPFALGALTVSVDEAGVHVDWPLLDEFAIPYGRDLLPSSVDNFSIELAGSTWPVTFLAGAGGGFDYLRTLDRYVATRAEPVEVPQIAVSRSPARELQLRRALDRRDF